MSTEAIRAIAKAFSADEVYEVTTFEAYIEAGTVIVELYDSHVSGDLRYYAKAFNPDIPEENRGINSDGATQGNPASTIEGAIQNLHSWIFRA